MVKASPRKVNFHRLCQLMGIDQWGYAAIRTIMYNLKSEGFRIVSKKVTFEMPETKDEPSRSISIKVIPPHLEHSSLEANLDNVMFGQDCRNQSIRYDATDDMVVNDFYAEFNLNGLNFKISYHKPKMP